jgi:hypothetical protein
VGARVSLCDGAWGGGGGESDIVAVASELALVCAGPRDRQAPACFCLSSIVIGSCLPLHCWTGSF